MYKTAENAEELRDKFWKSLSKSPFVMLELVADVNTASPMTAQLDEDANSALWFFTSRDGQYAAMGDAKFTFASKGHDIFARVHGHLSEETSRERREAMFNNFVAAWFPGGVDDPDLLMMRMDLENAEIWNSELSLKAAAKMMLGLDVREDARGYHTETAL